MKFLFIKKITFLGIQENNVVDSSAENNSLNLGQSAKIWSRDDEQNPDVSRGNIESTNKYSSTTSQMVQEGKIIE